MNTGGDMNLSAVYVTYSQSNCSLRLTRHGPRPLPLASRLEWGLIRVAASKSGSAEVRDSSRSIESATGGSTDKNVVAVMKKVIHEDVDTDEFELDSDMSTDNV